MKILRCMKRLSVLILGSLSGFDLWLQTASDSNACRILKLLQQQPHLPPRARHHRVLPARSSSPTSRPTPAYVSNTTAARSAKSISRKPSVQAAPFSTTTTTAGRTSSSSTRWTGPKTKNAARSRRSFTTTRTAPSPTLPRNPASASKCTALASRPRTTTTTATSTSTSPALVQIVFFATAGGGKFVDVTARAGVGDPGFSTAAAWFDYDNDGKLDLFVGNYVEWSTQTDQHCSLDGKNKSYCTPQTYKGQSRDLVSQSREWKF